MGWDKDGRKEVIRVGVEFFEDGSRVKAVDENSLTTGSLGVREEVEELEATRIGLRSLGVHQQKDLFGGRNVRSMCCPCEPKGQCWCTQCHHEPGRR